MLQVEGAVVGRELRRRRVPREREPAGPSIPLPFQIHGRAQVLHPVQDDPEDGLSAVFGDADVALQAGVALQRDQPAVLDVDLRQAAVNMGEREVGSNTKEKQV